MQYTKQNPLKKTWQGSITLLVVRADKRTGRTRDRTRNVIDFAAHHQLPPELAAAMEAHVTFRARQAAGGGAAADDEAVLKGMPTSVRRRVLRHLHLEALRSCYLFQGCGLKFLDALLAGARVELYMPQASVCERAALAPLSFFVCFFLLLLQPSDTLFL